jgi:pSer/pThr/pTyr-binding forkhead associated (FHA) protein
MSEVWLARRNGKREDLVVKRILPHLAADPLFVQMFLNEARIAARFNQRNIARIYDFGEAAGSYFITMEYIHGEDLGRVMRKAWNAGQWIAQPVAMRVMSECLAALAYAHGKTDESGKPLKVVHRDISPQNILISFSGEVKLVDFGIAKAADVASTTQAGAIKGKFAYMSPEQAVGKPLDHRADIFSAGLVLYELLTGVRPLQRSSEVATHVAAMECKIDPPSAVSETPADLDMVVMKALAKAPGDRYPDAEAFRRSIDKLCGRKGWEAGPAELSELMRILFADRLAEEGGTEPPAPAPEPEPEPEPEPGPEPMEDEDEEDNATADLRALHAPRPEEGEDEDENDATMDDLRRSGRREPSRMRSRVRGREPEQERERLAPPVPEDDSQGRSKLYRTGENYQPAREPKAAQDAEARDIYGEDDPLPEALDEHAADDDDGEATRAGPPRKLVVVEGPDKGMVKRFGGVRMVVGRTDNCNMVLSDKSVSRRHLEMVQGERGVLLRDLGSGNGTKVNGERVDERLLHHEDVVEIGQTKFQFIDEAEAVKKAREAQERKEEEERRKKEEAEKKPEEEPAAAEAPPAEAAEGEGAEAAAADQPAAEGQGEEAEKKPAEAPAPVAISARSWAALDKRQRIGVMGGIGVTLTLVVVLMVLLFRDSGPPPPDPKLVQATKKMEQAKVAVADGRLEDAISAIETAERLSPGIDEEGLLPLTKKELAARKSHEVARAFIEQNRFEDARAELARTPQASSAAADEHEKLKAMLDEREAAYLEKNLEDALAAGDPVSARQVYDLLQPDRQGPYMERLRLLEEEAQAVEQLQMETSQKATQKIRKSTVVVRKKYLDDAFRAVERKFQAQDYDRAILECDRVMDGAADEDVRTRALSLKRLIPNFQRAFEDGIRKYQAGAKESALRPLQRSRELYGQIGLYGGLGDALDEMLVESLVASARAALARGDVGTAARYYYDAQRINPQDSRSADGLQRIAARAEELYSQAYQEKDIDPEKFLERMRLIRDIAPKNSETYRKAMQNLQRTKGRAP